MNIEYFREGIEIVASSGMKLTPEQILLIENSLIILQNENHYRHIFFWGRINGIENDYFIAFGYTTDCLVERKFYYSINCFEWIILPPPCHQFNEACIYCLEMFIGDPSVSISIELDPRFTIDEKQIILATEPEICRIKEEDRLAATIAMITEESALLPRGGLYKTPDTQVVFHPDFRGLNELQSDILTNYQLYRKPQQQFNYNLLKRDDYNYAIDFLDTFDDIIPYNQAFSLNMTLNDSVVLMRSLIWPGMSFFHKLYSRKHGFVYFGNAKKNLDLLFMLSDFSTPKRESICI